MEQNRPVLHTPAARLPARRTRVQYFFLELSNTLPQAFLPEWDADCRPPRTRQCPFSLRRGCSILNLPDLAEESVSWSYGNFRLTCAIPWTGGMGFRQTAAHESPFKAPHGWWRCSDHGYRPMVHANGQKTPSEAPVGHMPVRLFGEKQGLPRKATVLFPLSLPGGCERSARGGARLLSTLPHLLYKPRLNIGMLTNHVFRVQIFSQNSQNGSFP